MHRLQTTEVKDTSATQSEQIPSNEDYEILITVQLQEESVKEAEIKRTMSGSLKVKAALQQDGVEGSSPEIRRFAVRGEGEGSDDLYTRLLTTVQSVFGISPQHQHCSLFWKDEDEDLVQFSTTKELRHAMDNMCDDTLRIYATVTPDITKEASSATYLDSEEMDTNRHVTFQTPLQSTEPPQPQTNPSSPLMGPGRHCGRTRTRTRTRTCKQKLTGAGKSEEFNAVRQQVPAEFRTWVRQYVRTWYAKGDETARQVDSLPDGAPLHFPQWLNDFLQHWTARHAGKSAGASDGEAEMAEEAEEEKEEMLAAPEGLSPVYYRWLCLFVRRFSRRQANAAACSEEGEELQAPGGQSCSRHEKGRHGCHAEHGCHAKRCWHGKKGDKHGGRSSSSESEDLDSGEKLWQKVPQELRKYVRKSIQQLHKRGDNSEAKEKATRAGLSPEVLDFVQQFLLEWHAKLSHKRPAAVAEEMMEEEEQRTLPSGLEREHFLWLCRFMARWHRRHAGKCNVMSGWSSEETTDDTSGDEAASPGEEGCGQWPHGDRRHFWAAMRAAYGQPYGMIGHPHRPFAMHHGMDHPCPPFLPPPFPRRCGGWSMAGRGMMMSPFRPMGCRVISPGHMMGCRVMSPCHRVGMPGMTRRQDCRRQRNQDGATSGQASKSHDETVACV